MRYLLLIHSYYISSFLFCFLNEYEHYNSYICASLSYIINDEPVENQQPAVWHPRFSIQFWSQTQNRSQHSRISGVARQRQFRPRAIKNSTEGATRSVHPTFGTVAWRSLPGRQTYLHNNPADQPSKRVEVNQRMQQKVGP